MAREKKDGVGIFKDKKTISFPTSAHQFKHKSKGICLDYIGDTMKESVHISVAQIVQGQ